MTTQGTVSIHIVAQDIGIFLRLESTEEGLHRLTCRSLFFYTLLDNSMDRVSPN